MQKYKLIQGKLKPVKQFSGRGQELAVLEPSRRMISCGQERINMRQLPFPFVVFSKGRERLQVSFANEWQGLDTKLFFPTLPNLYSYDDGVYYPPEMCTSGCDKLNIGSQIEHFWRSSFTSGSWVGYNHMLEVFRTWRGWENFPFEKITEVDWPKIRRTRTKKTFDTLADVLEWNKEQANSVRERDQFVDRRMMLPLQNVFRHSYDYYRYDDD